MEMIAATVSEKSHLISELLHYANKFSELQDA